MTDPDLTPANYPAEPPAVDLDRLVAESVAAHVLDDPDCDWCTREATVYVEGGDWLDKACPKHRYLCGKGMQLPMRRAHG